MPYQIHSQKGLPKLEIKNWGLLHFKVANGVFFLKNFFSEKSRFQLYSSQISHKNYCAAENMHNCLLTMRKKGKCKQTVSYRTYCLKITNIYFFVHTLLLFYFSFFASFLLFVNYRAKNSFFQKKNFFGKKHAIGYLKVQQPQKF